jgi:hypothetical protein
MSKAMPTLNLKIGRWFEANATGWGIAAIPLVMIVLVLAAALGVPIGFS